MTATIGSARAGLASDVPSQQTHGSTNAPASRAGAITLPSLFDDLPPPYSAGSPSSAGQPVNHPILAGGEECKFATGKFYNVKARIRRYEDSTTATKWTEVRFPADTSVSGSVFMRFQNNGKVDPFKSHLAVTCQSASGKTQRSRVLSDLTLFTQGEAPDTADGDPSGWFAFGQVGEGDCEADGLLVYGAPQSSVNPDGTTTILT